MSGKSCAASQLFGRDFRRCCEKLTTAPAVKNWQSGNEFALLPFGHVPTCDFHKPRGLRTWDAFDHPVQKNCRTLHIFLDIEHFVVEIGKKNSGKDMLANKWTQETHFHGVKNRSRKNTETATRIAVLAPFPVQSSSGAQHVYTGDLSTEFSSSCVHVSMNYLVDLPQQAARSTTEPIHRSDPLPRRCRSVLRTSLTCKLLWTRSSQPWRPDAVVKTSCTLPYIVTSWLEILAPLPTKTCACAVCGRTD